MKAIPHVELSIQRIKHQYFVLVIDQEEINQVGPLTRKQALNLHFYLADAAISHGLRTQPIRKPVITDVAKILVPSDKPIKDYPISDELLQAISQ